MNEVYGAETIWRRKVGRYVLACERMPVNRYTRAEVFYGRDAQRGDGSLTVTLGALVIGLHWGGRA